MSLFLCEQSGNLTLDSAVDIAMNTKGTQEGKTEFSVERRECSMLYEMLSTVADSLYTVLFNFPGGSEGNESACNVGDQGSIPGSGRSPGEGNVCTLQYPCQYSWSEEPGDLQSMGSQKGEHN